MSDKRHEVLLQHIDNSVKDRTELRSRINKLKNDINKRLKELETFLINQLADSSNSTDDFCFNSQEHLVASDEERATIMRDWFHHSVC